MSVTSTKPATVTVAQAARRLGVSEATVRRRIDDGELAGFRLGSIRRVLATEIERLTVREHLQREEAER
jgi:excisionase family DNA binding protein